MLLVDLVVEDVGHEQLLTALVERICREEHADVRIRPRSVRGGSPQVDQELRSIVRALGARFGSPDLPDILVVARDTDCKGAAATVAHVQAIIGTSSIPHVVIATPDPVIERWLLLDGAAFAAAVGETPLTAAHSCEKDHFKHAVASLVSSAGHIAGFGGFDFAEEIVEQMDLAQAGRADATFGAFCSDFRGAVRLTSSS